MENGQLKIGNRQLTTGKRQVKMIAIANLNPATNNKQPNNEQPATTNYKPAFASLLFLYPYKK